MVDLDYIISKTKVLAYHKKFEHDKSNSLRKCLVFLRMHTNRLVQSILIVLSNPHIWRYVLRGFLAARSGSNCLRSLEIALTYRCNAKCEQCSCRLAFNKEREQKEALTIDETKKVIDQAIDMGAFQFVLNGGEPLLEEDKVFTLTHYLKKERKRYVHLCTNGILLTEEKIIKLKQAGIDSIEMGFDSIFQELHDNNRVKGSYNRIIENIKLCRKHGITVILNTILTNDKVLSDDIIYTVFFAKKMGCLLQITPCCLTGAFKNRFDVMLNEDAKFYFHWLLSISRNNRSDLYSSLTTIKCPAAREKIGLQPYGDVVSCPLIQITYGNVRTSSLKEIQENMLRNPYYSLKKTQGCLPAMSKDFINKYLVDRNV